MFQTFPDISMQEYPKELKKLLDKQRSTINDITAKSSASYSDVMGTLQDLDEELSRFFTPLSHLNSVMNSDQTQDAHDSSIPLLSTFESELTQNETLYRILKKIEVKEKDSNAVMKLILRDFRLSGAELDDKEKKRMKEIDLKLSELSSDFSKNLLDSTNEFEMILENPEDVAELPSSDLDAAKIETDGKTKYRFTLQAPSYLAYMTYGSNRTRREEIYRAYSTRAPKNSEVINQILAHKDEKSRLLGFDNFAQYALESRDAQSVENVLDFLETLTNRAMAQAKSELEELKKFAYEHDGIDLQSHDVAYYSEKLKKSKFGFDDTQTKPYFEQQRVLDGMLDLISDLFGVTFKSIETNTWHQSVKVYDIVENNKQMARIYFDLEARKEKRGGAWMHDWETHFRDRDGGQHLPSAFVVANFSPDTGNTPSLLRHDDVVTLFHEMGHAIHHLFSKQQERSISGINGVAWDVVEFPSQFLENFAYEEAILRRFGFHHETGDPIPLTLIAKIKESKNFQAAMGILRQVEFATFDMLLHQRLYAGDEVQELLDSVREKTALLKPPAYNRFQHGFSHIFAGGYAAGYYSYKWAEVFSADAFFACLDTKNGFNTDKAKGYKEHILSSGSISPMNKLYKDWLGYQPATGSLLELYGIDEKGDAL